MRQFLKKITPPLILDFYKSRKKRQRAALIEKYKSEGNVLTQLQLEEFLKNNGIKAGDVVMLHSSLSRLGYVENGANTIIDAFKNVLTATGTLAMPAFPASGFNYDYLIKQPVFEQANTPSKTGVITEKFRKQPGVTRGLHPTDSVIAFGPQADYLVGEQHLDKVPHGSKSPFFKLTLLDAKIILLGVDLNSLTNLHTLEDAVTDFKFPVYHSQEFKCKLITQNGQELQMITKTHDPKWSKQRKCNELIPMFKKDGCLIETKINNTTVYIIQARGMHESMMRNYTNRGVTMYTPEGSN